MEVRVLSWAPGFRHQAGFCRLFVFLHLLHHIPLHYNFHPDFTQPGDMGMGPSGNTTRGDDTYHPPKAPLPFPNGIRAGEGNGKRSNSIGNHQHGEDGLFGFFVGPAK
ncbi:hypothetical protein [Azospira sp. I13]|uniref:hypothetical protein n=1 Tax=Azospira sp. I13 TaxID=1765050 RepID=UPI0010582477|nr:hypothetical protein [Azospira sp. I13]